MNADLVDSVQGLLKFLFDSLGPGRTLAAIGFLLLLAMGWRLLQQRRADHWSKVALDEKERSVQRLAEEARSWRILFVRHVLKLSRQEADKIISRNEFATPEEARRTLEENKRAERKARRRKQRR